MRRLQRRQPGTGGGAADTDIAGEVGAIEELRGAQRRGAQEALVVAQARYLEKLPEVALQVRRHVGPKESFRFDVHVLVKLGEAATHQELLDGEMRMRGRSFRERERLQLHDAGASRQRVGDRLHEAERLRAGEEEGPSAPAVAIDGRLQVAEEARRVLHLVDDDGWRISRKKGSGVALGLLRLAREIQRDERVVREQPRIRLVFPVWRAPVNTTTGRVAARCRRSGSM